VIVVSDTSPVRALIAINRIDILHKLFSEVYIPRAVENELLRIQSMKKEISGFLSEKWVFIKNVSHDANYEVIRKIWMKEKAKQLF